MREDGYGRSRARGAWVMQIASQVMRIASQVMHVGDLLMPIQHAKLLMSPIPGRIQLRLPKLPSVTFPRAEVAIGGGKWLQQEHQEATKARAVRTTCTGKRCEIEQAHTPTRMMWSGQKRGPHSRVVGGQRT